MPNVGNFVNAIADAGDGDIIVVGQFRGIDGVGRDRIAKLRVVDGSLVSGFVANANSQVFDVAVANDRAYVGGTFGTINGVERSRLAAVNLHTGDVDPGFDLPVTVATGWEGASSVRAIDVSNDGTILATAHNDALVDGVARQGVALIDISGPVASVLPWQTDTYDYDCQPWFPQFSRPLMRDVAFAPDDSFIVVASAIGNYAPACDSVVRFPTEGGAGVAPEWVSRMFDTPETLAVSDQAIYVGGHMRWTMAAGTVWTDFADGNTDIQPEGTVVRDQIVALSPEDGTSLDWDPGAGGFRGVLSLEVVDSGLLAGSDGNRFGGEIVGRHASFELPDDIPAPDDPPVSTFVVPLDLGVVGQPFPLIVESTDDSGIADVAVTIRNTATGLYRQLNGTFGPVATDLSPLVLGTGTVAATTLGRFDLPAGTYTATATATDLSGTVEGSRATATFTVNSGAGTASPDGRFEHPDNHEIIGSTVTLSGIAWDDRAIDKARAIVRNLDTGDYLQNDGSFAPGFNRVWLRVDEVGAATVTFSRTLVFPVGKYRAWLHLKDDDNNRDPVKNRVNFRVTMP